MNKVLLIAAVAMLPLFSVAPAFAMKGIDAARACNANPRCKLTLDTRGGALIIIDGTVIDCGGPQEECIVVANRARPTAPGAFSVPQAGVAAILR